MRWTKPTDGTTRVIKCFALFPICIVRECRWLEWCYIKQVYYRAAGYYDATWNNDKFVIKEDYESYKEKSK